MYKFIIDHRRNEVDFIIVDNDGNSTSTGTIESLSAGRDRINKIIDQKFDVEITHIN